MIEAARAFISSDLEHPSVILLGVPAHQLLAVADKLESSNIRHRCFYEPDIGDQLTAIATEPIFDDGENRQFFRKYQLLKEKACA